MPRPDPTRPQPLPAPGPARRGRRSAAAGSCPPRLGPVQVLRGVDIPMRDGTTLRADVYLPTSTGPHPTVLLRSPYGRGAGFAVTCRGAVRRARLRGRAAERPRHVRLRRRVHARSSTRSTTGRTPSAGCASSPGSTAGSPRSAPATSATRSGRSPWTRRPSSRRWCCTSARTTSPQAGLIDGAFQLTNLAIWTELIAHQERVGLLRGARPADDGGAAAGPAPRRGCRCRAWPSGFGGNPAPWFDEWLDHPDLDGPLLGPLPRHPGRALLDRAHPAHRRLAGLVPRADAVPVRRPPRPRRRRRA